MTEWWNSLDLFYKVIWGITLVSSLIFVIQSIMTFIGADTDGAISDVDAGGDFGGGDGADGGDGSGANLYTFRNLVVFCLGFGWSVILLGWDIKSLPLLLFVSVLIGAGMVAVVFYLFKFLSSMQQSGTIDVYKSAVGCTGTAYLAIPAAREGDGIVQITINNSVREYHALTDGEAISTGTPVVVVEVIDANTLLVEKQNSIII